MTSTETDWVKAPLVGFDLETTGIDPLTVRIVTASLVTPDGAARNWLLNPEIEIPESASNVHGVTTAKAVAEGQNYKEGLAEIANAIRANWAENKGLVAYNASYDFSIMHHECMRVFGRRFPIEGVIVDPFVIDRAVDPFRKGKRSLEAVSKHYRVELENAHESEADALAAVLLAEKFRRNPEVYAHKDPMKWQAHAHAEKQASFRKYLRGIGKDDTDVSGEWPVRGLA